jgi:hypothetical protein
MLWARMVAYVTGTVNQELLLRNEYLGAENRILRGQIDPSNLLAMSFRYQASSVSGFARRSWIGKGMRAKDCYHRYTEQRSYSHGRISKFDAVNRDGHPSHQLKNCRRWRSVQLLSPS